MFNKFITIVLMNALWLSTAFSSTTTIKAIDQIVPFTGSLGIGGAANANAILDAQSTTKALIIPRMTTTQKNAITPSAGMMVFDTTLNSFTFYNGTSWLVPGVTTGAPQNYWAGDIVTTAAACPAGTVAADGTSYLRTTYPDLFTAIGTTHGSADGTHFNVPDYRGRFIRGVDGAAGLDPDKAARTAMNAGGNTGNNVGSVQADAFQGHEHNYVQGNSSGPNVGNSGFNTQNITGTTTSMVSDGTNGTPRITSETRAKNAYVNFCIRTANAPGFYGNVDNFSVNFGTTNISTACSGSPCFIDQIGTAVSSITRTSAGTYVLNTAKTYTRLNCSPTNKDWISQNRLATGVECTSCNSATFSTANTSLSVADAYGGLICQGSY